MRSDRVLVGALAVVLLTSAARAEELAGEGAPAVGVGVRAEQMVPADCILFVELSDIARTKERLKSTPLGRIYGEDEVGQFLAEPLKRLMEMITKGQQQAGFDFLGATKALKGQCAVCLLGITPNPAGGEPIPDIAVVVGAKGDARKDVEALVGGLLARVREMVPELGVQEYQYGGARVKLLALGEAEIAWTFVGDLAVGALGRGTVEKLLDNLGEKKGKVLADDAAFKTVKESVGKKADFVAYASGTRFYERFRDQMGRDADEFRKSGLADVAGGAYAITAAAEGFREVAYVYSPEKKGVLKLLDQKSLELNGLSAVPADAVAYLALRVDPKKTLDAVFELVGEFDGADEAAEARQAVTAMTQQLGIDLEKQVYEALTGELQGYVAFPEGGGFPDFVVMAELAEADPFSGLVDVLKALALADMQQNNPNAADRFNSLEYRGRTFHYFKLREKDNPMVPTWCIDNEKKWFLVASSPPAMKRALIQLDADAGLDSSAAYASTTKRIVRSKSLMLYLDTKKLFGFGYGWAQAFMQNLPEDKRTGFDPNLLPLAKSIAQHLTGWAIALGSDEKGVALESSGPIPILPAFGATGAIAGGMKQRRRAQARRRRNEEVAPDGPPPVPEGVGGDIF